MTEREKALGYVQMLKNEGYLDEDALRILKEMYDLKPGEAEEILEKFKTTPEFKRGAVSNIKAQSWSFLAYLGLALCFAYAAFGKNGFGGFSFYFLFFLVISYAMLKYLLRLLDEAFNITSRYRWIKNPALPLVVIFPIALIFLQYKIVQKTYLASKNEWVELDSLVLESQITEVNIDNEGHTSEYEIPVENYLEPFVWHSEDHLYCFNKAYPDKLFSKGDTISLWVQRNENPELNNSTFNKVWDIEKSGVTLLNLKKRNVIAKQNAETSRNITALIVLIAIGSFIYYRNAADKAIK